MYWTTVKNYCDDLQSVSRNSGRDCWRWNRCSSKCRNRSRIPSCGGAAGSSGNWRRRCCRRCATATSRAVGAASSSADWAAAARRRWRCSWSITAVSDALPSRSLSPRRTTSTRILIRWAPLKACTLWLPVLSPIISVR